MKRVFVSLIALIGVGAVTFFAGQSFTVQAGKTYDNRDLDGIYHYAGQEVIMEEVNDPPVTVTDYCNGYGTLTFDGVGSVTRTGTDVCSVSGTSTEPGQELTYEVDPDGSFLMVNVADPTGRVRGQIVNKGRTLLLDGTERNLGDQLSFFFVAAKQ